VLLILALALSADSSVARRVVLAPAESIATTEIGSGKPVVFVASLLGGGYTYRKVIPLLTERGYRAIIIEPLGTGASSFPTKADYSLTSQADRVGLALDSLGIRDAILVGQGMASSIALRLAYRRPDLIRAVLSVDGGVSEAASTPGMRGAAKFAGLIKLFFGVGSIRKRVNKDMRANAADTSWVTPDIVNAYIAGQARDLDATIDVIKAMVHSKEPESLHDHLDVYQGPVHFLIGGVPHPTAMPDTEVAMLSTRIRRFSVDTVVGAAQYIQEENPDRVRAAIEWLDGPSVHAGSSVPGRGVQHSELPPQQAAETTAAN
jgi:pimeloyl-ACP methyl ester carboxylesterase